MRSAALLGLLAPVVSAFCAHGTSLFPRKADTVEVAEYGFDAAAGPLNWHGMAEGKNKACAVGKNQSPINIDGRQVKSCSGRKLKFDVASADHAEFENLGATVEVVANGTITRDGKTYSLKQFHFHTPSEHRLDDEYYPMEVHFVFEADDQSLSVVGIFIEVSDEDDDLLKSVFEKIDDISEPGTVTETDKLDFKDLNEHVDKSTIYEYTGSLTTPPCKEEIAWNVVKEPINIGVGLYKKIKKVVKFNARYTQNDLGKMNLLQNACMTMTMQQSS